MYIHNERIPDEAYRLDGGHDSPRTVPETIDPDGAVAAELSAALSGFSGRVGSICGNDISSSNRDRQIPVDEAISEMDDATRRRLRDLGYL
jgi:hypothetical protein